MSVIASDFEEDYDFSKTSGYQAPVRQQETVFNTLNKEEEEPKENPEEDMDTNSILPDFLQN